MRPIFYQVLAAALVSGCVSASEPCTTDSECYDNEVCSAGLCAPRVDSAGRDRDADTVVSDQGHEDVSSQLEEMGGAAPDMHVAPREDMGSADPDVSFPADMPPLAVDCIADRFASCPDPTEDPDGNTNFGDRFHPTVGCAGEFEGLSITKPGRMCPLDPQDLYLSSVVRCEDRAVIVEGTLRVLDDCDPALIAFEVPGYPCGDGTDGTAECETFSDGRRRIRVTLPPTSSVQPHQSIRWKIHTPDHDDVLVDYELDVEIR